MAPLSLLPGVQLTGVQDQAFPQGSDTPEGANWYIKWYTKWHFPRDCFTQRFDKKDFELFIS